MNDYTSREAYDKEIITLKTLYACHPPSKKEEDQSPKKLSS